MSGRQGRWRWVLALGGVATGCVLLLEVPLGAERPSAPAGPVPLMSNDRTLADVPPGARPVLAGPEARTATVARGVALQAAGEIPAGLTAEQWREMQAALADYPQREAEIRRITAFLQLQSRVQAFADARRRGAARSELLALAQPLQAELPAHLALGELSAGEALRLQAALLEVTEPDAGAARQALATWRAGQAGQARADPREAAFVKAQQAVVARWQAAGGRDPQALEHELEALRRTHFDARP